MIENYRRYQRYSICSQAILIRRDGESPQRLTVQVITISQGGMGFYCSVPLEKAIPVSVELMCDLPEGLDVFEGRIASICPQDKDYFTGIAFSSEISYERFVGLIS